MSMIGGIMVPHPPIILPEVGQGEEKKIQNTIDAYEKAADLVAAWKPETIVLSSPHSIMYADYFHISPGRRASGSMAQFRAPQVQIGVDYDTELVKLIRSYADRKDFPAGTLGERDASLDHGTMIPLYFINQKYTAYHLVRVGLSGLSLAAHYRLGMLFQKAVNELGRRVVWVASGDLSHKLKEDGPYGLSADGPVYDQKIMDVMGNGDFGKLLDFSESFCDSAAECGHRSFVMMAGAFDGLSVKAERLSHEGTFGVGYGVCTYEVTGEDEHRHFLSQWQEKEEKRLAETQEHEDPYVRLARQSLTSWITKHEKTDIPEGLPKEMLTKKAGVFVSLHEDGRLRGCIGTISPVKESIAQEIIDNAISASTKDPRFQPVRSEEIPRLSISVDVLGPTEQINSTDQLDVKRYGVVVTQGYKRGLLLPNLDGVDTVEDQVAIAKQKAGIPEYDDNVQLERFEVVRHF